MDRKSIIVLVICFVLLLGWHSLVDKLYPPKPLPPGLTNSLSSAFSSTNQAATSPVAPPILEAAATAPKPVTNTNLAEELIEVTNANAHYTFSSYGGGLKLIE